MKDNELDNLLIINNQPLGSEPKMREFIPLINKSATIILMAIFALKTSLLDIIVNYSCRSNAYNSISITYLKSS